MRLSMARVSGPRRADGTGAVSGEALPTLALTARRLFAAIMATTIVFAMIGIVIAKPGVARADTTFASEDVFASVGNSQVQVFDSQSGNVLDTLTDSTAGAPNFPAGSGDITSGSAFDSAGNFYVSDLLSGDVSEYSPNGTPLGQFATGLNGPEALVFDSQGNLYVGQQLTPYIAEFAPDGTQIGNYGPLPTELYGVDWLDLSSDQCTIYYTTEGSDIMRYNKCLGPNGTQEPNFNVAPFTGARAFELRILANGDVLVADSSADYLLDPSGNIIQTYSCSSLPGCQGQLFSVAVDPNGTDFWTGDSYSGDIWEVNLATGQAVDGCPGQAQSPCPTINTNSGLLYGMTVKGELRVAAAPTVVSSAPTALSTPTTSSTTIEVGQPVQVSDVLTDTTTNMPIPNEPVTFTLNGTETCTATTDATGTATCPITPGEPSGTYTLTASFAGDSTNGSSSSTSSSPPNGSSSTSGPVTITPDTSTVTYTGPTTAVNGQPITLTGTLTTNTPSNDTPLPTKDVTFTIGSQSCSDMTGPTGQASCTIPSVDQTTSNVTITTSFPGDVYDTSTSVSTPATVTEPTALTVNPCPDPMGCDYADQTTVSGTLMDTNLNVPVANEPVLFNLDGQTCTGTTNSSGVASCSITPNEQAATYTLTGTFAGDTTLALQLTGSSNSSPFVVTLEEDALTYTGGTIAQNGNPLTVSGVLSTDDPVLGTGIAGRTVTFTLGSGSAAQTCMATTSSSGAASCVINVTGQPTGPIPVTDNFASDGYYQQASASGTVNLPEGTQLTITSTTGTYGGPTTVTGTLTNTYTNQPVPNEPVTLTVNGTQSCTANTNASGVATCSVTPNEPPGSYSFTATFPGDTSSMPQLNPTSTSSTFTVNPAPTSFSYTGTSPLTNGSPATISGTLTTSEPTAGTSLGGQPVTLTIGSGSSAQSCTGTTNASGYVSCTIPTVNQTAGTVNVTSTYGGNVDYKSTSGWQYSVPVYTPTKLTVNSGTSDYNDACTEKTSFVCPSATLTNALTGAGIGGETVTLTLNGTQSCSGTTASNGRVSCSITPNEAAGSYPLTGSFGGDSSKAPQPKASSGSNTYVVTHEETAITYTGGSMVVNGVPFTLSSNLTTDGNPLGGRLVTMTLGSGSSAQSCTGTTLANGSASCIIASPKQVSGTVPITAVFAGDAWYVPASARGSGCGGGITATVASMPSTGAFVIGDKSAGAPTIGTTVDFWGSQYWHDNSFSGSVTAPATMKGWLDKAPSLTIGGTWTADTSSANPPSSVPVYMVVIVSSWEKQSGSTETGDIKHLVVVQVQPGYGAGGCHTAGFGTIIGIIG
jgi:hypothetical protein